MRTLGISIMAHPSRAEYFPYLTLAVGDVKFSIDEGWGIIENNRRAWAMHDKDTRFHLVLQDDAIVCENFIEKAEAILKEHAGSRMAFSFYYGKRKNNNTEAAEGLKKGYVIKRWLNWGLAVCLSTGIIDDMQEYYTKQKSPNDDTRIAKFLVENKIPVYYPIPSLIDHRDGKSLVNDTGMERRAAYFVDKMETCI